MLGISFHLSGAEFVGLNQYRIRDAVDRKGRGIEQRLSGNRLLRRFHIWHEHFGRLLGAGGKPCQRERCAHDLEEIAAALVVDPLGRLTGKFAMQEVFEALGRSQFIEAAPIPGAFRLVKLCPYGR